MRSEHDIQWREPSVLPREHPVRTRRAHRAQWLPNEDRAHAAMVGAIESAQSSVRLEIDSVRHDGPGMRILNALRRARERGVAVRVMIDGHGFAALPSDYFDTLRATGVDIRVFNPRRWLRSSFRSHRKLLLCDERVAIIGGFTSGPDYDGDQSTRGGYDLGLKLQGPVVRTLVTNFDALFELAPFTPGAVRAFRERQLRAEPTGGRIRMLASGPGCLREELRQSLHKDLRRAEDICVLAADFFPTNRIRRELARCVARGGQVRLLLAGSTDEPMAKRAREYLYPSLLEVGVQIFEYQPQRLDANLLVIDDVLLIGSCNLDRQRLSTHYELLVRLKWSELAEDARQLFSEATRYSVRVEAGDDPAPVRYWSRFLARFAHWLRARIDPLIKIRQRRRLDRSRGPHSHPSGKRADAARAV